MAQYISGLKVPSEGSIRHIAGLGHGDYGYDVLVTTLRNDVIPCVIYYFVERGAKMSVSVAKSRGTYFIELGHYSYLDSISSYFNQSCTLKRVPRKYLMETVKAYRAYRILFNEYIGIRDEIIDATKGLECIYLGNLSHDLEGLVNLLKRLGFHPEGINANQIKTKEGISISLDGICMKEI